MGKTQEQPKDLEIADRARRTAKILEGRIHVSRTGICLVSGATDFRVLRSCLQHITALPTWESEPQPSDLGFRSSQVTILTTETLAHCGHSLQKWRKVIHEQIQRRQKDATTRTRLAGWVAEAEFLGKRLDYLHVLMRAMQKPGWRIASGYVTDMDWAGKASGLRGGAAHGSHSPPSLWSWYAQIVSWMAGEAARTRYQSSLKPFADGRYERETRGPVLRIVRHAKALLAVAENAPPDDSVRQSILNDPDMNWLAESLPVEGLEDHGKELAGMIQSLPSVVASALRLPKDTSCCAGDLKHIISRCNAFLASDIRLELNPAAAGIAALCMLDGSSMPIPFELFLQLPGIKECNQALAALFSESRKESYDRLIEVVGRPRRQTDLLNPQSYRSVRELLALGASAEEVDWLGQYCAVVPFAKNRCMPTSIHRIVQRVGTGGVKCEQNDVYAVLRQIGIAGETSVADSFRAFMDQSPPGALTRPLLQTIWNRFVLATYLSGLGARVHSVLSRWATPPARLPEMPGAPAGLNRELDLALRRLAYYQKLAGKPPAMPGSINTIMGCKATSDEELVYLENKLEQGILSSAAWARLIRLRRKRAEVICDEGKALRQAEEVTSIAALEAIAAIIDREADLAWSSICPRVEGIALSVQHKIGIASWIATLNRSSRQILKELLDAWARAGSRYRHELTGNSAWIGEQSNLGVSVVAWTNPPSETLQIGARSIRIMVAEDPIRVFLMGAHFETCLDIASGCNRDAVLSNAYEANKAVLFAVDADGRVITRKLVALNKRSEMIGFRLYSHYQGRDRYALDLAIQEYCGRWAAASGVRLGDEGEPDPLTTLFWYDDHSEAWSREAHSAYARQRLASNGQHLRSNNEWGHWLRQTALAHWPRCTELLRRIHLWPLKEGESAEEVIAACPGLVEELLARVAWQTSDKVLAERLFRDATTPGGRLEAETSLARIQGTGGLSGQDQYFQGESPAWSARAPAVLVEIGTAEAIRYLAEKGLKQDDQISLGYLMDAIDKSPAAARMVARFLAQETGWNCQYEDLALLVKLIGRSDPKILTDAFLASIAQRIFLAPLPDKGPLQRAMTFMGVWQPRPKKASRVFDKSMLEKAWGSQSNGEKSSPVEFRRRVSILLWCLRNPCAGSLQFLQGRTGKYEPIAILSLAILAPRRFKRTVENALRRLPHVPALAMAYQLTHDMLDKDFDPKKLGLTPGNGCQDWNVIAELTKAIGSLDWGSIAKKQSLLSMEQRVSCLPWLMWNLWGRLDSPSELIFSNRLDQDAVHGVWDSGLHMSGFLLQLSERLSCGRAFADSVDLRDCVQELMRHRRYAKDPHISSRQLLWMDRLSGHRLYECGDKAAKPKDINEHLMFEEVGNAYGFLFDKVGQRNPICRVLGGISCLRALPLDLEQAVRIVELMVEKNESDGKVYYKPQTEIEKRLIQHYLHSRKTPETK